jgi:hypothetical protein
MAINVKRVTLWRREVEDKPGELAATLGPPAHAGADLQIVMGYRYPDRKGRGAVEVSPIGGKKIVAAARAAGLAAAPIPALLVEGVNKRGLGHAMADALAAAGINVDFLVALVIGRKYGAVFGFERDEDAKKAAAVLKKAAAART